MWVLFIPHMDDMGYNILFLVVSNHLKNMSQIGSFPQVGVKKKGKTTT